MVSSRKPPESCMVAMPPGASRRGRLEQQQRVGEVVQSRRPRSRRSGRTSACIGGVVAGDGAGMADRQGGALGGPADLQRDHRDVALAAPSPAPRRSRRDRAPSPGTGRRTLRRPASPARSRDSRRRWWSAPARPRPRALKPMRLSLWQSAGIGRAGMGDEGDAALPHPGRRREAADAQAVVEIVEPHAIAAADLRCRPRAPSR